MWKKRFVKYTDICFRDHYSEQLFADVGSVRYAPDLLFSYERPQTVEIGGNIAISVFDPFMPSRKIDETVKQGYFTAIKNTVCELLNSGRKVSLLGFCSFEGDAAFIDRLIREIPDELKDGIAILNYSFDNKNAVLDALAQSEYIIGTRLHSIILGLAFGKKVLPIVYNQKIKYILEDIGFDGKTIGINDITDYASGLAGLLGDISCFDVSDFRNSDDRQFEKLDKFLK